MEALSGALKVLFEKRFVPTVIGVIVGILVYALVPDDNLLLVRLGRNWFVVFFACLAIIIVSFIQYLVSSVPRWKYNRSIIEESKKYEDEEIEKAIHQLWDFLDNLPVQERNLIEDFLNSGNKPMFLERGIYNNYCNSIFDNTKVLKQRIIDDDNGYPRRQYVLEESFYNNLLYSQKKYGRISNFKEDI